MEVYSNEGLALSPRGDNIKNSKNTYSTFISFVLQNRLPISTKLETKHPWVRGITDKVHLNDRPSLLQRRDYSEIVQMSNNFF